jgi:hypothetical protein
MRFTAKSRANGHTPVSVPQAETRARVLLRTFANIRTSGLRARTGVNFVNFCACSEA